MRLRAIVLVPILTLALLARAAQPSHHRRTRVIAVDTDRLVQSFLALVQIDSVTYEERAIIERLAAELDALGLPSKQRPHRARWGGQPARALSGLAAGPAADHAVRPHGHGGAGPRRQAGAPGRRHQDGRPDGTRRRQQGERGGTARSCPHDHTAQPAAPRRGSRPHLGEERGHAGAVAFDAGRLTARMGVTMDDTRPPGHVTVSAPAYCSIHARFIGRAAHAGAAPEHGINAIAAAAAAIGRMRLGRIDAETTSNVGLIRGGTARNSVPGLAEIEAEARSRDNGKLAALVESLRMALEDGARSAGATVEATIKQEYAAYQVVRGRGDCPRGHRRHRPRGTRAVARRQRRRQRCEHLQRKRDPVRQPGDRDDGHPHGERVDRGRGSPEDRRDRAGPHDGRVIGSRSPMIARSPEFRTPPTSHTASVGGGDHPVEGGLHSCRDDPGSRLASGCRTSSA